MKDITIENFLKNLKNALDTSQLEVIKERRGVTEKELLNEINIFLDLKKY